MPTLSAKYRQTAAAVKRFIEGLSFVRLETRRKKNKFPVKKKWVLASLGSLVIAFVYQNCALNGEYLPVKQGTVAIVDGLSINQLQYLDKAEVVQLSVGGGHGCDVALEGGLQKPRCWGSNNYGQLGTSNNTDASQPQRVMNLSEVLAVVVGDNHSCALIPSGQVYCWGRNDRGQLGLGNLTQSNRPMLVSSVSNIISITSGANHVCAVGSNGRAYCWGDNSYGQIDRARSRTISTPTLVSELVGVEAMAAGVAHTCAIMANTKQVYCWGDNSSGQIARTASDEMFGVTEVTGLVNPLKLYSGHFHVCTVNSDTRVQCWGLNTENQTGVASGFDPFGMAAMSQVVSTPYTVPDLIGVRSLALGAGHTCAVMETDGSLRCWGLVPSMVNGIITAVRQATVMPMSIVSNVREISSRHLRTCASLMSGGATCWNLSPTNIVPGSVNRTITSTLVTGQSVIQIDARSNSSVINFPVVYLPEVSLPAGLYLNPASGIIRGAPSQAANTQRYNISIQHAGTELGRTSIDLSIIQGLSLSFPNLVDLLIGVPVPANFGVNVGGGSLTGVTFRIEPPLPTNSGLIFNTLTGAITGTPSALMPATNYQIIAMRNGLDIGRVTIRFGAFNIQTLMYPATLTLRIGQAADVGPTNASQLTGATYMISATLPAGLQFNTSTGRITGAPTASTPNGTPVPYTIIASRPNYVNAPATIRIAVLAAATLSYPPLNQQLVSTQQMQSWTPSYTGLVMGANFTVSPQLPPGMVINNLTGIISGTPNASRALQTYQITATSPGFDAVTTSISFAVLSKTTLTYPSQRLSLVRGAQAPSFAPSYVSTDPAMPLAPGAPQTYTITPALNINGLSFNSSTGQISGTPGDAVGARDYRIAASATGFAAAETTLTIEVLAPQSLAYNTNTDIVAGRGVNLVPSYSGSAATKTFSVQPGLPGGLSLNSGTGVISGTPSAAQAAQNYIVTVASPGYANISTTISIEIRNQATLSYNSPMYFGPDVSRTSIPSYSTSNDGATYSINPSLPTGISFNTSTGAISGIAQQRSALSTYTVAVRKAGFETATASISLETLGRENLSYANPVVFALGAPAPAISPVYSGRSGTSFFVSGSTPLPAGLALNQNTGVVIGVPSAEAEATIVQIRAEIAGFIVATADINISVKSYRNVLINSDFDYNNAAWNRMGTAQPFLTDWQVRPDGANDRRLYLACSNQDANSSCTANSVYQDVMGLPVGSMIPGYFTNAPNETQIQAGADIRGPANGRGVLTIHLFGTQGGAPIAARDVPVILDSSGHAQVSLQTMWNFQTMPLTSIRFEFYLGGRGEYSIDKTYLGVFTQEYQAGGDDNDAGEGNPGSGTGTN